MNKILTFIGFRILCIALMPLFGLVAFSNVTFADGVAPGVCTSVTLPVTLTPSTPADQTIKGTLCKPFIWRNGKVLDVLVHGATYSGQYWDWPIKNVQYSYVNDTLLAGRAVFVYDSVGAGRSSHPLSTDITIDASGFVLHQVLMYFHAQGTYTKFDVVGHSLGSVTAVNEAARYHDENNLVLTGYSHAFNADHAAVLPSLLYPANQDPQFSADNFDSGYITSVPGTRGRAFYSKIADPTIIAYDEGHKDVVSATELSEGIAQTMVPASVNISRQVTASVFEIIGQDDFDFCGTSTPVNCAIPSAVQAFNQPYFLHSPSFTATTVPLTGHDLALHPTNLLAFVEINRWLETH